MEQLNIFDLTMPTFKIDKPVRLIELFGGVGSQAMALRDLGVDFEHHLLCEWDVYSIASHRAIHYGYDKTDYSKGLDREELICILYNLGVSNNGKAPMTEGEVRRRTERWLRETYNNIRATKNIANIMQATGESLKITETDKYTYIVTYSFPCQDLSPAGKGKGMAKGAGTRSGLLWEVERLLNEVEKLPQVLLMENVPEVKSAANKDDFHTWQDFLASKGYTNYVDVLNAKDFGVAQNRNRCFMVSIFGEYNYKFPQPIPLIKTVNDYLEDEVDEKYYISSEKAMNLIEDLEERGELIGSVGNINPSGNGINGNVYGADGVAQTLTTNKGEGFKIVINANVKQVGNIAANEESFGGNPQTGRVYKPDGLCPALNTMQGGGREPKFIVEQRADEGLRTFKDGLCGTTRSEKESGGDKRVIVASRGRNKDNPSDRTAGNEVEQRLEVKTDGITNTLTTVAKDNMVLIKQATQGGKIECKIGGVADLSFPTSKTRRGRVQDKGDTCPTLMANNRDIYRIERKYRLRKLIPLECWRLMNFTDEDFYKAATVVSDSQLYKQAGNSIVKAVLMAIFKQML